MNGTKYHSHHKSSTVITVIQKNLSIKDNLNKGHLSIEDTPCCQPLTAVYKSTSELGTPHYTGQPAGSQWCPLYRGSTVYVREAFSIHTLQQQCVVMQYSSQ